MTRKDYNKAVEVIKQVYPKDMHLVASVFEEFFKQDNDRFDAFRFRKALESSEK